MTRAIGPSQQSMTAQTHYCGADENQFLGAHNPECPHWHPCACSPKHSSLPVCHRCSCEACAAERARWAKVLGWGRPRQTGVNWAPAPGVAADTPPDPPLEWMRKSDLNA